MDFNTSMVLMFAAIYSPAWLPMLVTGLGRLKAAALERAGVAD